MLLEGDLGFVYRVLAAAIVFLCGPVSWFVVHRKWRQTAARREEIRRLMALASDEAARAEFEAEAGYRYAYSYGSSMVAEPREETVSSVAGTSPVRQSQYQCEVCFSATTTRCKQCKAVRYCSGRCQIIHWRQGHKDECRPCTITHQNIDVGVDSSLKGSKLDEVGTNDGDIGNHGEKPAKLVDLSFREQTFMKPSLHEVSNEKNGNKVENVYVVEKKESDVKVMLLFHSLPGVDVESKSLSLKKPAAFDSTDNAATNQSSQFKFSCTDLDSQSGSSTSSGQSGSRSDEHSLSEPSTPSSGFWEGVIDPIISKTDTLDECGHLNLPNSHQSEGFSNMDRVKLRPLDGPSSDANSVIVGDPGPIPAKSASKMSEDQALLAKEVTANGFKSTSLESLNLKVAISDDSIPSECISKLSEVKCSTFSASGHTKSNCNRNLPNRDVKRDDGMQSLASDVLNNGDNRRSSISQAVLFHEVDSLASKAAGDDFSSGTRKLAVPDMHSEKIDRAQRVDAFASQSSCQSRKSAIDNTKSVRTLDQLRDSKLMSQSQLCCQREAMGKLKGLFPYDLFVKLYNWNKVELHPCGLINCGNSCYANVVLQCLAFTPPLTAYFIQKLHSKACKRKEWCFTCEFENLVLKASEGHSTLLPIKIISKLQNIGSHLANGREEDAHEFLRYAIEAMQLVCLKESGLMKRSPLDEETTLLGLTFGGYLRSKIECIRCGGKSERHERIMDLTVEIEGDIGTLQEAIQQFTQTETLDGENKYHCSRCRSYEKAKKKLRVLEAPNVLTIALKRFQADKFGKLNKRIKFPEILNLAPYMSGTSDKSPIYQLYGVVVHLDVMNSTFSGHYVCYIKNNQGKWFKADDSIVQEVGVEKVLTEDAYMLLYARCSPRAPRLIRTSVVTRDSRKAKNPTCKSRAHSSDRLDVSTCELNDQTCKDCFYLRCRSSQPIQTILEEETSSENSSYFSEVGSYSTDSTNPESTSTDDSFDPIYGDPGVRWNRACRNSTDSDTSSSSSSPSPLHSRHSRLSDFDFSSLEYPETWGGMFSCAESDGHGFWAGEGRSSLSCSKQCRNLVGSSSCREHGSNKLGQNYDNVKCSNLSSQRRSMRERAG